MGRGSATSSVAVVGRALVTWALVTSAAVAQDATARRGAVTVLRPEPGLDRLAQRTARLLERRTTESFRVGPAPPPGLPEAVEAGEIALASAPHGVRLVLVDGSGRPHATQLPVGDAEPAAMARATALAVQSLRDAASEAGSEPGSTSSASPGRGADSAAADRDAAESSAMAPADRHRLGRLFPRPGYEPKAKPTIYLRMLLGASPLRGSLLLGPGAGVGLCVDRHCVVIEGDLSLIPQTSRTQEGAAVRYRSVNASLRAQLRPFEWGAWAAGITMGLLTRIGTATLSSTDRSRLVTNLGVRSSAELAWRFAGPFEWVAEAGLDVAITRARFVRARETVFLEDRWTPWVVTGLRVRP